jgi:hypothetical protein
MCRQVYLRVRLGKSCSACESTVPTRWVHRRRVIACGMDKKQINDPKMTLNFLIWVGGVFMLLLFAFLAHFVWRLF